MMDGSLYRYEAPLDVSFASTSILKLSFASSMYSSPMSAFRYIALLLVVTYTNLIQAQSQAPGYFTDFSTIPASNNTFSFGQHYAVLNLDLIVGLVAPLANTTEGAAFIDSTVKWQNAVHAQKPPPLSIYTRIYSLNSRHVEVAGGFAKVFGFQPGTIDDPNTQLYPPFVPIPDYDVDLKKIRYYAGTANELELILSSQKIDTVVLVCSLRLRFSQLLSPLFNASIREKQVERSQKSV